MAKSLSEWMASDVEANRTMSIRALSERFFFRDPVRPPYSDSSYLFSPADGVVLWEWLFVRQCGCGRAAASLRRPSS